MGGGIIAAKLNLIPVRRGYWGNKIGLPHTVAMKVHGKCGSVRMRLVPAPRGTGVVGAPATKKMLAFAGVRTAIVPHAGTRRRAETSSRQSSRRSKTYAYLTPDLWK